MKNRQPIEYKNYRFSLMEGIKYSGLLMGGIFVVTYLFYGSFWFSLLLFPCGLLILPLVKKGLIHKRKKELKRQFREGLYALSSSVNVGRSIESAFEEALGDLKIMGEETNDLIISEFQIIVRKVRNNETLEEALIDFENRAWDEDVSDFVNVFVTANRAGGNLVEIMKFTTQVMSEKMEIADKIHVILSEKRYEQKIMAFMLPMIILYLHFFSGGFMDGMYHSVRGRISMTMALVLYGISFFIGNRIMDIEV